MKILETISLALPGVELLRYARFQDDRGYFTETYRRSDFEELGSLRGLEWVQHNESHSRAGVLRGLHFQWSPYMGKLVRTVRGRMLDLVLDLRIGSPTRGRALAVELAADPAQTHGEWIWVPPGFAHGNFFPEETTIEYLCTGEYSPGTEAGISPLSADIDWSLCGADSRRLLDQALGSEAIVSEKDAAGLSLGEWFRDSRSDNFRYDSSERS